MGKKSKKVANKTTIIHDDGSGSSQSPAALRKKICDRIYQEACNILPPGCYKLTMGTSNDRFEVNLEKASPRVEDLNPKTIACLKAAAESIIKAKSVEKLPLVINIVDGLTTSAIMEELKTVILLNKFSNVPPSLYGSLYFAKDDVLVGDHVRRIINCYLTNNDGSDHTDFGYNLESFHLMADKTSKLVLKNCEIMFGEFTNIKLHKKKIDDLIKDLKKVKALNSSSLSALNFINNFIVPLPSDLVNLCGFKDEYKPFVGQFIDITNENMRSIDEALVFATRLSQDLGARVEAERLKEVEKIEAEKQEKKQTRRVQATDERIRANFQQVLRQISEPKKSIDMYFQEGARPSRLDDMNLAAYKKHLFESTPSKRHNNSAAAADASAAAEVSSIDRNSSITISFPDQVVSLDLPLKVGTEHFYHLAGLDNVLISTLNISPEHSQFADIISRHNHHLMEQSSLGKSGIKMHDGSWLAIKKADSSERLVCVRMQHEKLSVYIPAAVVGHAEYEVLIKNGVKSISDSMEQIINITSNQASLGVRLTP